MPRQRAEAIRCLILDVDGVLTDGRIIMASDGTELKCFDVKDGHGIVLAHRVGLETVLLSGRKSPVVEQRAQELGIKRVYQKVWDKLALYEKLLEELGLTDEQVAYMGDDVVDVPVLKRVGLAIAVADAHDSVKAAAHYVTHRPGGRGAVREAIEFILKAQGRWSEAVAKYGLGEED
jgi:3-deoxy-D-manno-octulosonate 8-phosphate phosphatase (KDO 8-P phosphatase)